MTDLATKVPEEKIIGAFAGVMAISPDMYDALLRSIATECGVLCDGAFRDHVQAVLAAQPPIDPEDF